jgi:AraC-like DNA-binding protein
MLAMLDDYAEKLLVKLEGDNDIVQKIKAVISEHLQSGDMTLSKVASTLGMSERNLQRKLKEQQCNYQKLVDDTRKMMALKLISNSQRDFAEITYLLGFSDQSTFQRNFKKWTGVTPGTYRASH